MCLWGNSSRQRKITKNVILFKKAISVLSALLNASSFRAISSVGFFYTLSWIINGGLISHCLSGSGQLAQMNKAVWGQSKQRPSAGLPEGWKKKKIHFSGCFLRCYKLNRKFSFPLSLCFCLCLFSLSLSLCLSLSFTLLFHLAQSSS